MFDKSRNIFPEVDIESTSGKQGLKLSHEDIFQKFLKLLKFVTRIFSILSIIKLIEIVFEDGLMRQPQNLVQTKLTRCQSELPFVLFQGKCRRTYF